MCHASSPLERRCGRAPSRSVPLADRAIGNLQQWLIGTYHGVSKAQLQVYLDEFVFRHNRRRQPMAAFQTLLGLGRRAHADALSAHPWRADDSCPNAPEASTTYWGLLKQPDKQETALPSAMLSQRGGRDAFTPVDGRDVVLD